MQFTLGLSLTVGGAALGFSAAPGVLIAETVAHRHLQKRPATGLILGYTGIGLVALSPVFAAVGAYEVTGPTLVVGATLGCIGGPIQFAVDDKAPIRVALIPTPGGVAWVGTF